MSKKVTLPALFFILLCGPLYASINSIAILPVGTDSQNLEAESVNNPVFHMRINADVSGGKLSSLAVKNTLDSWGWGSGSIAAEPGSIAGGKVLVWYVADDSDTFNGTAQYVTSLAVSSGTFWANTLSIPLDVADGSGIWVTIDLPSSPAFGVMQMQSNGLSFISSTINSIDEPATPPVLMLTSSTAAKNLEVSHSSGSMQAYVSTSQDDVLALKLHFFNDSGPFSAPCLINCLTLTVQTALGVTLSPSSVFYSLKILDADNGSVYGELSGSFVPSLAGPAVIPVSIPVLAGATVTANVILKMAGAAPFGINFTLSLGAEDMLDAVDSYTGQKVSVYASATDAFPIISNFATLQEKALSVSARPLDIIPQNINKGQTNTMILELAFDNPGNSSGAYAEIYNLKFRLKDSGSGPIIPGSLFSKISVTDLSGAVTYGYKTAAVIESSGNVINMALPNPIAVPAASSATITVKVDVLASTAANNFKIGLDSTADISARDKNSFYSIPSSAATLPFYSSLALLSSSFAASHTAFMPSNLYKNQSGIHVMDITMGSPLSFGNGNILVRGISLTAKNALGQSLALSSVFSGINLQTSNQSVSFASLPSSSTGYFEFPYDVTVTAVTGETISIFADIKDNPASASVELLLNTRTALSAYQDNDPLRQIFIAPAGSDAFPMSSGTGYIGGDSKGLSFSAYPVPFSKTQPCRLGYYLSSPVKVTIKIYDVMGNFVKAIIENSLKTAGSHSEDTWNGTDKNNRIALSGAYIAKIDAGSRSALSKVIFIK